MAQAEVAPKRSDFLPDSPVFWNDIAHVENESDTYSKDVKTHLDGFGTDMLPNDEEQSFEQYRKFLTKNAKLPGSVELGQVLHGLKEVTKHQKKFKEGLHKMYQLNSSVLVSQHQYKEGITHYKKNKEKYSSHLKKYLSIKTGSPEELLEKDAAHRALKQQLEVKRFDIHSMLHKFLASRQYYAVAPLATGLRAHLDFLKAGYALIKPLEEAIVALEKCLEEEDAKIREVSSDVRKARTEFQEKMEREMELNKDVSGPETIRDLEGGRGDVTTVSKEGYLYLRPQYAPVWVTLKDGLLTVVRPGFPSESFPLLLCTVRTSTTLKLRFMLEIISPGKSIMLQADSTRVRDEWITVIQNAISLQLNSQTRSGDKVNDTNEQTAVLWAIQGNQACADCGQKDPDWTSINMGTLICKNCSGLHRALGVHISQVRSLNLDKLDPYRMEVLKAIGNEKANRLWEFNLPASGRPQENASRAEWEKFVRAKYEHKSFLDPDRTALSQDQINTSLFSALGGTDVMAVVRAMVWGADVNWSNPAVEERSALLQAIHFGNALYVELLLDNGAKLLANKDMRHWTALHYVAHTGDVPIAELLLARGGKELLFVKDADGQTPLEVAAHTSAAGHHAAGGPSAEEPASVRVSMSGVWPEERADNSVSMPSTTGGGESSPGGGLGDMEGGGSKEGTALVMPPAGRRTEDAPPPPPPGEEDEPPPPPPMDIFNFLHEATLKEEEKAKAKIEADMQAELVDGPPAVSPASPKAGGSPAGSLSPNSLSKSGSTVRESFLAKKTGTLSKRITKGLDKGKEKLKKFLKSADHPSVAEKVVEESHDEDDDDEHGHSPSHSQVGQEPKFLPPVRRRDLSLT